MKQILSDCHMKVHWITYVKIEEQVFMKHVISFEISMCYQIPKICNKNNDYFFNDLLKTFELINIIVYCIFIVIPNTKVEMFLFLLIFIKNKWIFVSYRTLISLSLSLSPLNRCYKIPVNQIIHNAKIKSKISSSLLYDWKIIGLISKKSKSLINN